MEPESSLSRLQELANCPYPEPDQSSPCPPIPHLENPSEYYPPIYMWNRTTFNFLYAFFWVILRSLNFVCRRFGILCSIFIGRWFFTQPPAPEDGTECSETSAHNIHTPGNNPEESIQHLEHDECLKSRKYFISFSQHSMCGDTVDRQLKR